MSSEFDGRTLVADSIIGVREFDVDSFGRLRGVTHAHIWTPGENEAFHAGGSAPRMSSFFAIYGSGAVVVDSPPPLPLALHRDHTVARLGCHCGFYAYTEPSERAWWVDYRVTGIIAGTGVVTVGSKGFRAQRAEIVALVDPRRPAAKSWGEMSWRERRRHKRECFSMVHLGQPDAEFYPALVSKCELSPSERVDFAAVARNYPDVPLYPTLDAAMAAHPLSEPPPPPCELDLTPSDPDFWTRGAL